MKETRQHGDLPSNSSLDKNIKLLLAKKHWSLKMLSEKSDIPYETLKKIVNKKITNPSLSTILKLSHTLQCSIDYLVSSNISTYLKFQELPDHFQSLLYYVMDYTQLHSANHAYQSCDYIPIFSPYPGYNEKLTTDFLKIDSLNITDCKKRFGGTIRYALHITTNYFHPVYIINDILLIGCDRPPHSGEVGLFLHNNKLYLRQYFIDGSIVLSSINGIGNSLTLSSLEDWLILGYVITIYKK